MLRDVFYYGSKPNVHPREQHAKNLEDARQKCTTDHFWIINEFCDYRNFDWDFDFEFLPDEDVWAEDHNNVWPSQHQKDSGTWLCPKEHSDLIIYRGDVDPVIRKNEKQSENWVELDLIDHSRFDFSWHPDPTDPPYIYKWGCKFFPAELKHVLEYRVPGATQEKYMSATVELLPQIDLWVENQNIDKHKFDMSWRPNPLNPPYIYVWGNKYVDGKLKSTLEYHMPGATDKKYMPELLDVLPEWDRWVEVEAVDKRSFDFSWRPDPREPAFIYVFGNEQHDATIMPTLEYHCPDATEIKYITDIKAKLAPKKELFDHLEDSYGIDYSWRPDPTSPPYIYAWGNQWNAPEDKISIQFVVEGATEYKYMTERAIRKPCMNSWIVPDDVDTTGFDFSWEPNPAAPPYIYEFATQWQKTGGPQYVVEGATEKQYVDFQKVKRLPSNEGWTIPSNIDSSGFDFSWHPDATSPPYVYVFATQWAFSGGPVFTIPGATEIKYVDDQIAVAKVDMTNWVYDPKLIDVNSFDFSWHPYVEDQPYIYEFGTQWQKTGGPKYITPGADSSSPTKYIDIRIIKSKRLPNPSDNNWKILNDYKIKDFDFSWHPDSTEEPYIYVFGNNLYPAEEMPTIEYHVPNAKQVKFVNDIVAVLDQDITNWEVPDNVDTTGFDFSWKPNPTDPAYIYEFGTQWQKTGGPRYVVPGATETKYLDFQTVTRKAVRNDNWKVINDIDVTKFDFSWHPDATDPAYIYAWGNQWVSAEDRPSIEYIVPGATEYRYMGNTATRLLVQDSWIIPDDVDCSMFDFSWEPSPKEEPYIYQFGTQHQKTGGPKFIVDGATEVKYVDTFTVTKLADESKFTVVDGYKIKDFDYSWHPDDTEEPFIYVFGNNLYPAVECPTIEYRVKDATTVKYVDNLVATLDNNVDNWIIPSNIDTTGFDFSWVPNPTDPAFVYEFGTQHQKTGGPKFIVDGATETKYLDFQRVMYNVNKDNWIIPDNIDVTDFDFSWHPDATDPAYIYQFGTQWALSGGPRYIVDGATEIKYMDNLVAKALPNRENWVYDETKIDIDSFDFSWHPYVEDQPYIYEFGTQHQKSGGPKYITPGADSASPTKYIDTRILKAKRLPNPTAGNWQTFYKIKDFDFSWHPDTTEEPYIYVFGNNLYPAEECPIVKYVVEGATQVKYIHNVVATLDVDMTNWIVPDNIDVTDFDFSWIPNPNDPPYIYEFGTQWQKTGGPRYVVPNATETKYIDFQKVIHLSSKTNWKVPDHVDTSAFDFSWHPDATDPPYIYQFGTQWALSGGPTYNVLGATEVKYMDDQIAKALPNKDNWIIDSNIIDIAEFDFSWHPYAEDQPYVYQFGTQWQKTGGPKYITPGADSTSPIKYIDTRIVKAKRLPNPDDSCWIANYKVKQFDWSWHPNETEEPYIYVFGNTQYPAEECATIEYRMKGATQVKYIRDTVAVLDVDMTNWVVPDNVDTAGFDFSWIPNPNDPPYIYEFATQWQKTNGPRYAVPGASEVKYIDSQKVTILPNIKNWNVPSNIDVSEFDFSWHPDDTDPPYIYQFGTQWTLTGGPAYVEEGATETKYIDVQVAKSLPDKTNWVYDSTEIDVDSFDFSWHPYSEDQPYIYQFGTQHQKTGGPRYITPGAAPESPIKYVDTRIIKAKRLPKPGNFRVLNGYVIEDFDYSWHPDETEEPYTYVFGNTQYSAQDMPTIEYHTPGATQVKYINTLLAKLGKDRSNWKFVEDIVEDEFDFSWKPNPNDPPYIYVFGNTQYPAELYPTVEYRIDGATEKKYVNTIVAKLKPAKSKFTSLHPIDDGTFDFSWRPNPKDPPYIYVFGNTQYPAEEMPTVEYRVEGATEKKYVADIVATLAPNMTNWEIPKNTDINSYDYSWVPHPKSPPYIYQFGTLVDDVWIEDGPRYITPGNDGFVVRLENSLILTDEISYPKYYVETTLDDLVNRHPNEMFWALNKNINYDSFDFSWKPDKENLFNVTVFGSPESETTHTYFVNAPTYLEGHTGLNFIQQDVEIDEKYLSELFVKPDIFYVDKGNSDAQYRFDILKSQFGNRIQKTRYLNSWVDTINRCINRSTTDLIWVLNSELDYSSFNFDYYPNPWQMKMVHVFGTQWSHWGTTFMVNRESFPEDTKYIKIIEHLSTLNFVKEHRAIATDCVYDIVLIDHGNTETEHVASLLQSKAPNKNVTIVKYDESYLNTIRNLVKRLPEKKEHYLWLCSSVCDYARFDLSYICDPFAKDNLHVFPSGKQKFGDTFFIDVNKTKEIIESMDSLEDYHKVNYNGTIKTERLSAPEIVTSNDTLVDAVKNSMTRSFPYAVIMTEDNIDLPASDYEPMNLWSPETKNIIITTTGATRIVAPVEAGEKISKELYDYPYIKRAPKLVKSNPLDIVFLSNGEACADEHYEHLLKVAEGLPNRIVRVDGVNGRAAAYHAAAEASNTPWMFTVFAKLKVSPKFDFNWQPDRMQVPKHYIFHAKNPVNGLVYGHQAMIAYNKKLTLANEGRGLDFTLDDEHEIVPLVSGTAHYNTDPFSTWRTAFREVLKLRADDSEESRVRLDAWLNKAEGEHSQYSIKGALDAEEYYEEVDGDFDKLKLSYEWNWLRKRFEEL